MYIAGRVVAVPLSNLALTGSWQQTARPWQSAFPGSLLCAFKQIDCSGHVVLLWSVYVPPPPTHATTTVKLSAMELGGSGWCGLELQWHVFDSNADHGTCFARKPRWWIWRRIRWDRQSGENGGEKVVCRGNFILKMEALFPVETPGMSYRTTWSHKTHRLLPPVMKTKLMKCLSTVYFASQPLHVSGISVAHHQEVYCVYTATGKCCV